MTDPPVILDRHRGMAAQKATDLRRLLSEVQENEAILRQRQHDLENQLIAIPAATWSDAAEKARYLLKLFSETPTGREPRRQKLIANLMEDFTRLSRDDTSENPDR